MYQVMNVIVSTILLVNLRIVSGDAGSGPGEGPVSGFDTGPASDMSSCVWVENLLNDEDEIMLEGTVASRDECISRVMTECPQASIANVAADIDSTGQSDCYCQYGTDMTPVPGEGWINCLLSTISGFDTGPASDMSSCVWIENNLNTENEKMLEGTVASRDECISRVMTECPQASIANVAADVDSTGEAECWCQYGTDMTPVPGEGWINCLLSTMTATGSGPGSGPRGSGPGGPPPCVEAGLSACSDQFEIETQPTEFCACAKSVNVDQCDEDVKLEWNSWTNAGCLNTDGNDNDVVCGGVLNEKCTGCDDYPDYRCLTNNGSGKCSTMSTTTDPNAGPGLGYCVPDNGNDEEGKCWANGPENEDFCENQGLTKESCLEPKCHWKPTSTNVRVECGAGLFLKNKNTDDEWCKPCSKGKFSQDHIKRPRRCKKCPKNSYLPHQHGDKCIKCPEGFDTKGQRDKHQCFEIGTGLSMKGMGMLIKDYNAGNGDFYHPKPMPDAKK